MTAPAEQLAADPSAVRDGDDLPWWKVEPLSILELADPLHVAAHGRDGFDPRRIVHRMRELNATAAHVFPLGCHLDGEVLFFRHRSPDDPPARFDYLGEWLEHSIPVGLRTVVYFNVHSVKAPHARRHPQWQQRRFDGSPKEDVYTVESTFCVNSPWRQWVFDRLRDLCDYPIDGIFFDGPVFFEDACFCPHCRERFEARFGCSMPPADALADSRFPDLVEFRADSIARFVRESRDVVKSLRPGALFYVNANPLQPPRLTARDNRKLAACQDVLASEGGFLGRDLMTDAPIWKVGLNAKLLETQASAAGVPHLVFDSVIHTPWTYYTLPAAEATLLWASSVAHGAGTWMSAYKDSLHRPAVAAVGPLYDFARRHRATLFDTRSLAEVAVVVSSNVLNFYAGADVSQTDFTAARSEDAPGNVTRELYGFYHALWAAHVPLDLLDDVSLERDELSRYRAIILPNVACLSDAAAEALDRFVRAGGTLLGSFETGLFDQRGRRRATGALDELFGIRREGGVAPPRRWDYLFDRSAGEGDVSTAFPSPAHVLHVAAASDARVPFTLSEPLEDRYAGLPRDSGRPAIVERQVDRGQIVYFACDFGAALWRWRLPEHLALVRRLIARCGEPPVRLEGAPPCLDLSLRQSRRGVSRTYLHLVNYNGGMTRPIERVLPVDDLLIRLRDPCVTSARTLFHPRELTIRREGQWVAVRLEALREYELIEFA